MSYRNAVSIKVRLAGETKVAEFAMMISGWIVIMYALHMLLEIVLPTKVPFAKSTAGRICDCLSSRISLAGSFELLSHRFVNVLIF